MAGMRCAVLFAGLLGLCAGAGVGADWVRPGLNTNQPVWGLRGGLLFALPPGGFRGGEPRGLIRLGYPVLTNDGYDLINFIAIEPVVGGRKGFSELESSTLDHAQGKRIWAEAGPGAPATNGALVPGVLTRPAPGAEQLTVTLRVEPFENGARVRLEAAMRSAAPDELRLTVRVEPDSAPVAYCILTATMGNLARTRRLWLRDEVVTSLRLHPDYRDNGFTPHTFYPLERLHRTAAGDVLVAVTTDEEAPERVFPFPHSRLWHYGGARVTQYWKKPAGAFRDDLHAAVNARHTYWMSRRPIPGGVAFENFELRERFHDGQQAIFGLTRRTPAELGFKAR
jgi:hypothetical protein